MSNFEQQYGSLSFTEGLPDYYGLPLEQINKTYEVLNQKYELNSRKWSALRQNIANSAVLNSETASVDEALANANKTMSNITETGNFHMADIAVDDAVFQFSTDKNMKEAFSKKAAYEKYSSDIDAMVKNVGGKGPSLQPDTAKLLKMKWASINQNRTHYDKQGVLQNSVNSPTIASYQDVQGLYLEYIKNIKPTDYIARQTVQGIEQGMAAGNYTNLGDYYKFVKSKEGVTDSKSLEIMESILHKPEVIAYMKQDTELKMMQRYGVFDSKKQVYALGESGNIKMRELTDIDLKNENLTIKNGIIYSQSYAHNAKGEMYTNNGEPTRDKTKAVTTLTPMDYIQNDNVQGSLYAAIASKQQNSVLGDLFDFAKAYSYVQTTWDFQKTPEFDVRAAKGIAKIGDVQMVTSTEADNIINNENNKTTRTRNGEDVARDHLELQKSIKVLFPNLNTANGLIFAMNNMPKLEALAKVPNAKGNAAKAIIANYQNIDKGIDDNNNNAMSVLYTLKGADRPVIDHVLSISSRFIDKGAPIYYLTPKGELTPEATAYCVKNGIATNRFAYANHIGLSTQDVNALTAVHNLQKSKIGNSVIAKNKPIYIDRWEGFQEVPTIKWDKAISDALTTLTTNATTKGTVISNKSGSGNFESGAGITLFELGQHLSKTQHLNQKQFNQKLYNTFSSSGTGDKLKDGEYFDESAGKTIKIKMNPEVTGTKGKLYATYTVSVINKAGVVEENIQVGYTIGSKNSQINTNQVSVYENSKSLANNYVQSVTVANEYTSDYYHNVNGKYVPGLIYIKNKTFLAPVGDVDQVLYGTENLDKVTRNGIEYYKLYEADHVNAVVESYKNKNIQQSH